MRCQNTSGVASIAQQLANMRAGGRKEASVLAVGQQGKIEGREERKKTRCRFVSVSYLGIGRRRTSALSSGTLIRTTLAVGLFFFFVCGAKRRDRETRRKRERKCGKEKNKASQVRSRSIKKRAHYTSRREKSKASG